MDLAHPVIDRLHGVRKTTGKGVFMRLSIALVSGVVVAGSVLAAPSAVAESLAVPTINWQSCGENSPGFECADVDVPLDYDHPRGATTKVAVARKPATDKEHRIGTLFVNPGGPGGSGVSMALGYGTTLSEHLDGKFDILGFDPRGIAGSSPVRCFQTFDEAVTFFSDPALATPYKREQERPYVDKFRTLGPKCQSNGAPIAQHMSTADVVRDMDLLRRAVGDSKMSYLGFSYGSFIGNTYASLFPNNIRALVIDGVLDPALWSSGWQIADDRTNTAKEFDEMLRLCDAAGTSCAFHSPTQTAKARWEALADSVRAKPVKVGDDEVNYDGLIGRATGAMYAPESWADFAEFLAEVATAAAGGTPSVSVSKKQQEEYPNFFEAYSGNVCADTEFPRSAAEYSAIGHWAEAGSRFGPQWWWSNAACADWPVNHDRFTGPWKTRTSAPVLVVGNYFDGVTSYAGAQASARNIKGSRLLSYAGWGHTAYDRSDCVTGYVNKYLLTGALPAEGTVCAANPNPFQSAVAPSLARPGLPSMTWPMR
jgi:pimeloyl-ACP methyl ester carboxylesterase